MSYFDNKRTGCNKDGDCPSGASAMFNLDGHKEGGSMELRALEELFGD